MNKWFFPIYKTQNEDNVASIYQYEKFYNCFVKRILGFIIAAVLLVILSPVMAVIAIVVIADTGFPVFYKGERCGYMRKNFNIYKFRTMVRDADKTGGGTTALSDSRITKTGSFLRKTKIDEFPQLINIIKGEMSFVGPRPELTKYTDKYWDIENVILKVRPGITDYSSLEYISLDQIVGQTNVDEIYEKQVLNKKNQLRIKYALSVSFKTDLNLFLVTLKRVFVKAIGAIFHKENKDVRRWNM